jgi:hypothetical protein
MGNSRIRNPEWYDEGDDDEQRLFEKLGRDGTERRRFYHGLPIGRKRSRNRKVSCKKDSNRLWRMFQKIRTNI